MLDLRKAIQDKFKEEISSEIFSVIFLKIKRISYKLAPFKVFCHWIFCSKGSRFLDTCSICSRIFVDDSDVARRIDISFIVTINLLGNLDISELVKYLNACCVILNLYIIWLEIMAAVLKTSMRSLRK